MKKLIRLGFGLLALPILLHAQQPKVIHMILTSDVHFGIFKKKFRGDTTVPSWKINQAAIAQMNKLPDMQLPHDKGVAAGQLIGDIDRLVITGDIANREEPPYQCATISWQQFVDTYGSQLHTAANKQEPQLLLVPGNHDVSNAIGYTKKMEPATDPTSLVNIYNLTMHPPVPLTNTNYNYANNKVNYSKEIGGAHCIFLTIWPDSAERIWIAKDLESVSAQTPVILFTHDPPEGDPKHFSNPAAPGKFVKDSKFENMVAETYKEGPAPQKDGDHTTDIEQRGWVNFLKRHPNIKAYFHGHENWNEFYTYKGPDKDINLPVFRIDSPMKGEDSAKDETKLSFQLISLDPVKKMLTVRQCLWNTHPGRKDQEIKFGESKTISLAIL